MPKKLRLFFPWLFKKMRFLPPKFYAGFHYKYHTGKKLNLDNPLEFNAKIEWYKVFYRPKILNQLVDKYAVREYVKEKIGSQYLNDIFGVYNNPNEIPFDKLPDMFVVKATHASGYNLIVRDKNKLDLSKVRKKFKKWLRRNQYYRIGQEWAYKDVQPRLLIEKYLEESEKKSLVDYKFYCFDGIPKFVDIHIDREEDHKQGCFDMNFERLPYFKGTFKNIIETNLKKPSNFDEMVMLSEKLSAGFPFVRVDFYSIEGKSIFGEMTFYPGDARKDFSPDKYNKVIGDYFKLPKLDKNQKAITKFKN